MWFNNKTLRSFSKWGLSLTLKELVMWAFSPTLCIYKQKWEGAARWREDQPLSGGDFGPPCHWLHTGGLYMHMHTHTGEHAGVPWRTLVSFGVKGEGWRVRQGRGYRVQRLNPSGRPILTATLFLHRRMGTPWGVGGLNLWPCWSTQGALRCPAIHDNQSERQERESQRVPGWSEDMRTKRCGIFIFHSLFAFYCPQMCPSLLYWT